MVHYIDEARINASRDSTRYLAMTLANEPNTDVYFSTKKDASLAKDANIVVMRMDPELDYNFSNELKRYDDGTKVFINKPIIQQYFADKSYLNDLAPLGVLPKTKISTDVGELAKYGHSLGDYVIVKPVVGFGGEGVKKVDTRNGGLEEELLKATSCGRVPAICQEFINEIGEWGDKRVWVVDGNPIGAVLRMPQKGEFLANQKKGASVNYTEITLENYETIEKLQPVIKNKGVFGLDLIGPYVGEVNGISPGLLYAVDEQNNTLYNSNGAASKVNNWLIENALELTS